jgi:hypothetical protein
MDDHDMTPQIDEAFFRALVDIDASDERVRQRIASLRGNAELLRFFVRYASWNGCFANGVTRLVSMIGANRDLFREAGFPRAVSDRSNYIASFIFDAARDEYDDHINPIRDTHRCMAQASLIGMKDFLGLGDAALDEADPPQLVALNDAVLRGYAGDHGAAGGEAGRVFAGIGYHLGSELLADHEFSLIDEYLHREQAALVKHLMHTTVNLAGGTHRCYAWVGVHSGHGGGVEADHFEYALGAARAAIQFLVGHDEAGAVEALKAGFMAFARDHRAFFAIDVQ